MPDQLPPTWGEFRERRIDTSLPPFIQQILDWRERSPETPQHHPALTVDRYGGAYSIQLEPAPEGWWRRFWWRMQMRWENGPDWKAQG